jgi:hypothetical protein
MQHIPSQGTPFPRPFFLTHQDILQHTAKITNKFKNKTIKNSRKINKNKSNYINNNNKKQQTNSKTKQ